MRAPRCNGSILKELSTATNQGLSADSSGGVPTDPFGTCGVLLFGPNAHIDTNNPSPNSVLGRVRQVPGCGQTSFADVLTVATAMGLFVLGGPGPLAVTVGKFDSPTADGAINSFPGGCSGLDQIVGFWRNLGFGDGVQAAVLGQGGHNIGMTRSPINVGCSNDGQVRRTRPWSSGGCAAPAPRRRTAKRLLSCGCCAGRGLQDGLAQL